MTLPSPIHDNYWRNRVLTEQEYAETIAAAIVIYDEEREKARGYAETVKVFLKEMEAMGHHRTSPEYKYVSSRVGYRANFSDLVWKIEATQRDLRKRADDAKRQKAEIERQREQMVELAKEAQKFDVDPYAYFGDEKGLRDAVDVAKEAKFEELLAIAPYYVKASFYGHCLRGDWSDGRHSYGCSDLKDMIIPEEDTDRPELHALAKELQEDAREWEGDDGRYFRSTYQQLDAILSDDDAKLLNFLNETHYELNYGH